MTCFLQEDVANLESTWLNFAFENLAEKDVFLGVKRPCLAMVAYEYFSLEVRKCIILHKISVPYVACANVLVWIRLIS